MRRAVLVVGVLLVALAVGVAWYLAPIGPIATGYAAQVGCGVHLVAERPIREVIPELPDNPLVPLLRVAAPGDGTFHADLLGAYDRVAVVTEDGGCRLVAEEDAQDLATTDPMEVDPVADDLEVPGDPAAAAAAAGFDGDALTVALDGAFTEDTDPEAEVGTRAVVVVHDGTVVAERYADGFGPDTPLIGWSMTKSIANAITGTLVADGAIALDDADLWPGWRDDPNDTRRQITVEHLLTMTDGLAFEEDDYAIEEDATQMLFRPHDMAAVAADMPLMAEPGSTWAYSSGTTNLLCEVLADADGGDPSTLAARRVFAPLGMTSAVLGTDASGDPVCSSFAYATARDWARFGLLYLQDGQWAGQRVLPEGWVEFTTEAVQLETENPYGGHWWLNADAATVRMPSVPENVFWASGVEGQQVVVVPSHDLVVVRLGLTRGYDGIEWGLEPLLAGIIEATPEDG